jgi:Ca-activated chloride channel homolog
MSFINPFAFTFAAALPVVVVFYLLKRKRVVQRVSSTVLWQKFLADTQASAPFQKLKRHWLLILQLLMLALAVLALSRPYFSTPTAQGRLIVAILDASASMQSTDVVPSRFEKARTEAVSWVDSLHDNDQMVVLQASASTQVKQSPTSNKAALRRAIQTCSVTDGPTRLAEALKLAETLTRDQPAAEVHLFSDGAATGLSELENKGLRLVYHRIGASADNLGLISLDVRAHPEDPSRRALYLGIANCSTNEKSSSLELLFNGQLLETRNLVVPPRSTSPQVFTASQAKDGIFTVRLGAKDDLTADNQASIVSLLPRPSRVLLMSKGNRFLEKAIKTAPNVELENATAYIENQKKYDVVILDDVAPTVWPTANTLAIHVATTNWFPGWKTLSAPPIVAWKNTHPLLRFVNFDTVQIAESLVVASNSWAVPLVESTQAPLMVAGELKRQRIIWLGFDTLQSTWPLRVSFPIFIANAIDWLNPAASQAAQLFVRAGDSFRYSLTQPLTNTTVNAVSPDGQKHPLSLEGGGRELVFGDTAKQGIYHVQIGTNDLPFCVNLLDAPESDITPRTEMEFGKYGKVKATTVQRADLEFWRWLAALGLGVLMFEWWYYHRRSV